LLLFKFIAYIIGIVDEVAFSGSYISVVFLSVLY